MPVSPRRASTGSSGTDSTSGEQRSSGLGRPLSGQCVELPFLVWNIQSPEFSPNALEFLPGSEGISEEGRQTMEKLKQKAKELMLDPASTVVLKDLLGEEVPLRLATELELAALTDKKTLDGLQKWLESRQHLCTSIWPGAGADELREKWAAEPAARWEYWKRQTLLDWLRDDCSGGKVNPVLPAASPTIDELCWNLGLSSADRRYARHPERLRRARWLRQGATESQQQDLPATGKFDFLKLLVWDLVVDKVLDQAVDRAACDALITELRPWGDDARVQDILARVRAVDLAVLLEVPEAGLPGLGEDFWVVWACAGAEPGARDSSANDSDNTVVLARRSIFSEPQAFPILDKDGTVDRRVAACELARLADPTRVFRVVGVHLPASGVDSRGIVPKIEDAITLDGALHPHVVLAGDFNVDLRDAAPPWLSEAATPRLFELSQQAKRVPLGVGTVSKERSPFQTQVSKMFLEDFCMKDFVLLGTSVGAAQIRGLVSRMQRLPNAAIPSDHAPLTLKLQLGGRPTSAGRRHCSLQ